MPTIEERDLRHIWHPCAQMKDYEQLPPMVIDHAKGAWLYDVHGKAISILSVRGGRISSDIRTRRSMRGLRRS